MVFTQTMEITMKLDKIKFARVISLVSRISNRTLFDDEMMDIDAAIDIDVPKPEPLPSPIISDVDNLMALMKEGARKIEAIKAYRNLTGSGLKESKDAV